MDSQVARGEKVKNQKVLTPELLADAVIKHNNSTNTSNQLNIPAMFPLSTKIYINYRQKSDSDSSDLPQTNTR